MKPSVGFRSVSAVSVAAAFLAALHLSAAFQCDEENNPYNCSCIKIEEYELQCPPLPDLRLLTVKVKVSWDTKNTSAEVSCRNNATASDFRLLDGINITSLEKAQFKSCPLPRVPFRQIFQLVSPLGLTELEFSGRDQSENITFQLEGLTSLETLDISDNSFRNISAETLGDVPNLTALILRSNSLTTVTKEAMDKVPKLIKLDLGKNRIASLSPGVFSSLTSLKRLLLDRNGLGNATLSSDIFEGLGNVEILDLGANNLSTLPGDFLKHLVKLKDVILSNNKFESLPEGLFKTNTQLESFKLFGNKASSLVIPEGLFENLSALTQINMDGSNIESLPENIFRGATALVTVSLEENRLKTLPATIFQDTINLKNLNLHKNKITEIPSQVFVNLGELQILDLSENLITNITEGVFWKTAKLENLSIENNGLMYLDKRAFQPDTCKIRKIDLSNNLLTFPNNIIVDDELRNSPLSSCQELTDINLSNNSITTIFDDWKITFTSLKKLNLKNNKITVLNLADNGFGSVSEIDVQNNNISVVVLRGLDNILNVDGLSPPVKIKVLLDGNPISCDCQNYHLLRFFERKLHPKVYDRIDLKADNLVCASPRAFKDRSIASIPSREVTCPLAQESHSAPCPASCECKIRLEDRALLVQCGGAHLTSAPDELPTSEETNHTELNISHNSITMLPLLTQPGYQNVTKLFASHNRISRLNISSLPSTLQVLELDHNNLTMLQPRVVEYITNLTNLSSLTLHNNSWDCQCGSLHFVNFVQLKYKQIPFLKEVKCADGRTVSNLTASGLCPNVSAILWVVFVGAICILICGLVIAYYRYQQEIKVWLFAHRMCLWWVTEQELDRDKRYDAFICFSHKDQDFVDDQIVPNLESGPTPFKLCIHTRDFIPGEWITNQIVSAVENSRRTIIVLSPNFVESEWGRMEFRTAHAQAMSEGRARVIVILYGDVGPTEKLEPELRAYLNMNTYVKWGDPWFWDKLRYALPHPPELLKNNPAMAFVRQASLRRKPLEDRLELICDPNCPSVIVSPNSTENDDTAINNEKNAKMNENGKIPAQPKAVPAS